jgi:hypothetical protein
VFGLLVDGGDDEHAANTAAAKKTRRNGIASTIGPGPESK